MRPSLRLGLVVEGNERGTPSPFTSLVSGRLCRGLISVARAALGDAALAKALSRWRRSSKLATPHMWAYTNLGAVSAMIHFKNYTPRMEYAAGRATGSPA